MRAPWITYRMFDVVKQTAAAMHLESHMIDEREEKGYLGCKFRKSPNDDSEGQ